MRARRRSIDDSASSRVDFISGVLAKSPSNQGGPSPLLVYGVRGIGSGARPGIGGGSV